MKRVAITRRTRIKPRSDKMAAKYVERRKLVSRLLYERPICERCKAAASQDCHEVQSRARGGSILDESNIRTLCRLCHIHVTDNPAESEREGWSKSRWAV